MFGLGSKDEDNVARENAATLAFPIEQDSIPAFAVHDELGREVRLDTVVSTEGMLQRNYDVLETQLDSLEELRDDLRHRMTVYEQRMMELNVQIDAVRSHMKILQDGVNKLAESKKANVSLSPELQEITKESERIAKAEQEALRDNEAELKRMENEKASADSLIKNLKKRNGQ